MNAWNIVKVFHVTERLVLALVEVVAGVQRKHLGRDDLVPGQFILSSALSLAANILRVHLLERSTSGTGRMGDEGA
jgi:hypothetical protein